MDQLPANALAYIHRIEALLDVPIDILSTGPERDSTIVLRHPFLDWKRCLKVTLDWHGNRAATVREWMILARFGVICVVFHGSFAPRCHCPTAPLPDGRGSDFDCVRWGWVFDWIDLNQFGKVTSKWPWIGSVSMMVSAFAGMTIINLGSRSETSRATKNEREFKHD